ncbi:hypothetical protein BH23BAC3_BH23BAC3_35880 [soil metagenome]
MYSKINLSTLLLVLLCLLILTVNPLTAQDSNNGQTGTKAWLKLGLGHSGGENFGGITGTVSAHYFSRYGIIGMRYLISERTGVEPGFLDVNRITRLNEVSVNWGYSADVSILIISASAGLGGFWGQEQTAGNQSQYAVISVPLETQILIRPFRFFGMGVVLSTSLNTKNTITSGLLVLQIGSLK